MQPKGLRDECVRGAVARVPFSHVRRVAGFCLALPGGALKYVSVLEPGAGERGENWQVPVRIGTLEYDWS